MEPSSFNSYEGKGIDIGINDLDNDHKLLLRKVINDNQYNNLRNIEPCEGGTNIVTASQNCGQQGYPALANHFHVNFVN